MSISYSIITKLLFELSRLPYLITYFSTSKRSLLWPYSVARRQWHGAAVAACKTKSISKIKCKNLISVCTVRGACKTTPCSASRAGARIVAPNRRASKTKPICESCLADMAHASCMWKKWETCQSPAVTEQNTRWMSSSEYQRRRGGLLREPRVLQRHRHE